ncbi:MAG TPA: hypothetical protein VEY87_00460 [Gaiellaceae bacterium]|jgi:hypothetical protein|nr:hypothetical protein [Gaiellaceae bacterium]
MRALLLLLAAVLVTGCGGTETTSPGTAAQTEASRAAVQGPGLDGGEITLDDFRGTPVLVNVWSSW